MADLKFIQIGIILSLTCIAILLILGLIKRKFLLDLPSGLKIIASCLGLITGTVFGYKACILPSSQLGDLSTDRVPIIFGAVSMIWISAEQIVKQFLSLRNNNNQK